VLGSIWNWLYQDIFVPGVAAVAVVVALAFVLAQIPRPGLTVVLGFLGMSVVLGIGLGALCARNLRPGVLEFAAALGRRGRWNR
jgi:hypothetical protein